MTIYASKVAEKKGSEVPSPEVVTDYTLLVENEKNETAEPKHAVVVTTVAGPFRKRHPAMNLCVILLGLVLMMALVVGCISLYKHLVSVHELYQGRCGVRYHSYQNTDGSVDALVSGSGEFEQQVEIDDDFEKIVVPAIGDTRKATILHDFNMNMTAIIDKEQGHCFVMNLDRTRVLPPRDFLDLLNKLRSGYYIPDAEVVQENYRAITPPIQDLMPFGIYIKEECGKLDTYRLVKMGDPIAMSKRSACDVQGNKFCLGGTGKAMMCFNIVGCL